MKTSKKERRERQSLLLTHLAIEASDLEKDGDKKGSIALWSAFYALVGKNERTRIPAPEASKEDER